MEVHKNNRYGVFITMVFVFFLLCLGFLVLAIEVLEMLSYNFLSNVYNAQDSAYPAVRFHYLCLLEATTGNAEITKRRRVLFWRTYDYFFTVHLYINCAVISDKKYFLFLLCYIDSIAFASWNRKLTRNFHYYFLVILIFSHFKCFFSIFSLEVYGLLMSAVETDIIVTQMGAWHLAYRRH
ncbi:hypothetical protein ACJX0J_020604 [Zea mays]